MKDLIRKVVLGALAVIIVVATMVRVDGHMSAQPQFEIEFGQFEHEGQPNIVIECPPLEASANGETRDVVGELGPNRTFYSNIDMYMTADQFRALGDSHLVLWENSLAVPGFDEPSLFAQNVTENIRNQCGILRDNQQSGLIMLYGQALLLLALLGIAATLTAPRLKRAEAGPS